VQQVGKHLYVETGYDWANVSAAVTDAGVVLVDSPVRPSDSKKWQKIVRELHPKGACFLITTDYHGDHTTESSFIEGIGEAVTFIAPQIAYEEISKGDNAFSKEIFVETLRDLSHTDEADAITNAPVPLPIFCWEETMVLHLPPLTFHIKRMGGHSPATSAVYLPEEGVLFSSDVVSHSGGGMRDAHLGDWIRALEWIESLPVETIVPGHGDICGKDVVARQKERMVAIKGTMEEVVKKGLSKEDAVEDDSFQRFFRADTSRGEYWLQQRKETFRIGLERVYDEVMAKNG
jgi:cyclase